MTSVRDFLGFVIVLFMITASVGTATQGGRSAITLEEAKKAAQQLLTGPLVGTILVPVAKQYVSGFYVFEVQSSNPVASPIVGAFAVNSSTGDVWDVTGSCTLLTSRSLRKIQADIRKRFEFTPEEFRKLRA